MVAGVYYMMCPKCDYYDWLAWNRPKGYKQMCPKCNIELELR